MQQETTRERLLESASREFLSNGYQKASLRTICRNAGVTTGALYFFFKDKSALFHALVKDAAEAVMDMEHDIRFAQELISFYYAHETALELLFNCSWGSAYQDFTEQIIAYLVKRNTKIISAMVKDDDTVFNACTLHWLSQIQGLYQQAVKN